MVQNQLGQTATKRKLNRMPMPTRTITLRLSTLLAIIVLSVAAIVIIGLTVQNRPTNHPMLPSDMSLTKVADFAPPGRDMLTIRPIKLDLQATREPGCFAFSSLKHSLACAHFQLTSNANLRLSNLYIDILTNGDFEILPLNIATAGPWVPLTMPQTIYTSADIESMLSRDMFIKIDKQLIELQSGKWTNIPRIIYPIRLMAKEKKLSWGNGVEFRLEAKCVNGVHVILNDEGDWQKFALQILPEYQVAALVLFRGGAEEGFAESESESMFADLSAACSVQQ